MTSKEFLRCVGLAVCSKGLKGLLGEIPLVGTLYEIAEDLWDRVKQHRQSEILDALQKCANMDDGEARRLADQIAQQFPHLKPEEQKRLTAYIRQVPTAARASLRRPADPAGRTLPPGLGLAGGAAVLPFLPQRLPRFSPCDKPAGVGDWELIDLLGMGGFGEVWKARHVVTGKFVAMKFCTDPAARIALVNEAQVLAQVQAAGEHAGIVTLLDT